MSERIELEATPIKLKVSRGETAESNVTVRNKGQTVDQFTISVEGIDPGWYTLPVSSVALFPNDQDKVKIIINLPENVDLKDTSYFLKVKVSSQEDPADTATADLTMEVGEEVRLGVSISPDRISGRKGEFQVSVTNPGNKEAQVRLKASSPQGRLRFKMQPESLTVPAAGRADATVNVRLDWIALILWEKTYDFQVALEQSGGTPAAGVSGSGQLVSVPWYRIFSGIRLPWLSRPPVIKEFEAKTDNKRDFQLKWSVQRATSVKLDDSAVESLGESLVHPAEPQKYTLTATNKNGTATRTLDVKPMPLPQARTSEKIKVSLSTSRLETQAGLVPAIMMVQVQNLSDIVDKFLVDVEGLDGSWYSRSASSLALMPKATDQVQVTLLPPKNKGVKSGTYPFAVTIRSQSNPQESASVVSELVILPAVEYKLKVHPYRLSGMRKGKFFLNLANVGVTEANISLEASDLDEGCNFRFDTQQLVLGAWNAVEVPFTARPKRGSFIGANRRFDITLTASTEGITPQTVNCEFNHQPFLKSWKPVWRLVRLIIVLAILGVIIYFLLSWGGGWSAFRASPQTWWSNLTHHIEGWFNR
jgi:uncharacterized membrane protein